MQSVKEDTTPENTSYSFRNNTVRLAQADFSASAAASSSCNFFKDGGGLTTMLLFHCLSSFLDSLLPTPSSTSLSRLTVSMRAICNQ
ncbi:hypothetical protein OIU74_005364 [Salix koriyanagi]|uniref:Uncharacterized protein n=1 Tax=Salix koriyanagi TaxID=2511006 RepID=A0A9Q0ZGJ2_9ROSI|nr:hypothetical protein OIU74_005364 [Salix koriyanagi]